LRASAVAAAAFAASGLWACAGPQSALDPHGPAAEDIAGLWQVLLWGAVAIFVLVMGLLAYATFRDPGARPRVSQGAWLVGGGLLLPTTVLAALLVHGTLVGRELARPVPDALRIDVVGHRWWWSIRYAADGALPALEVANELRLPVGVPLRLHVTSADVIHSFWIPNLGGKIDMIPGRENLLRLQAAQPGRFRLQCAEFCGTGHAHMNLVAIAEPVAAFEAWRRARRHAAPPPDGPALRLFLERGCGHCHAIAGTAARGSSGPDLTQFARRATLTDAMQSNDAAQPDAVARPDVATSPGNITRPDDVAQPRNVVSAGDAARLRDWLTDHGRRQQPGGSPVPIRLDAAEADLVASLLETPR
jgi:cytochrome c oxidase subunit 2